MATTTEALNRISQKILKRDFGSTGLDYWKPEYEKIKANAIAAGKTETEAADIADLSISRNVARSAEARQAAGVPDWFKHQTTDVALGERTYDWASKLQTSNLENYLGHQNYSYGKLQGNVVGQEGNEWWGYQTTQDIQSYLAQGKSWEDAYRLSTDKVTQDIMRNAGHQNYQKYGSIGYGNPLEIKTGVDADGDPIIEERYLNLSQKAIDEGGLLEKTGTKTATRTTDDGTTETVTPFSWRMVPDASAPGGYRITKVPFNTKDGSTAWTIPSNADPDDLSVVGQSFIESNYRNRKGQKTFEIPSDVTNVDASRFTATGDNKLDLAQWAETPGGQAAIASGTIPAYGIKNFGMGISSDGMVYDPGTYNVDHTKYDTNLGIDGTVDLDIGGGYTTSFTPPPSGGGTEDDANTAQSMMMIGGGGKTIVLNEQAQKSKTAADQQPGIKEKLEKAGSGRKKYQTKKKKATVSSSIPGAGGSPLSIPGA